MAAALVRPGELVTEEVLPIYQGDNFGVVVDVWDAEGEGTAWTPADLTGYVSATAQIRQGPAAEFPKVTDFTCTIENSSVIVTLAIDQAELLRHDVGYYYDLQLNAINPTRRVTILHGAVEVLPEVTR